MTQTKLDVRIEAVREELLNRLKLLEYQVEKTAKLVKAGQVVNSCGELQGIPAQIEVLVGRLYELMGIQANESK